MRMFPVKPVRNILGVDHLGTLELWHRYASPKEPEKQWKSGRSAMEMAKAWRFGLIPPEVVTAFAGTPFQRMVVDEARAEFKSTFDARKGPRNHDLVLFGGIDGAGALVDIEGKADEGFGNESVHGVRTRGSAGQRERVRDLLAAMMGPEAVRESADQLPYQLLYGPYATVKLAEVRKFKRALFLVQVFVNETCSLRKVKEGRMALKGLARLIDAEARVPSRAVPLVGPVKARAGTTWLGDDVEFWLGRVEIWQGRTKA